MMQTKVRKPMKLKMPSPLENEEQETFIKLMKLQYPDIKFRVGMEGARLAKGTRYKMKRQGMESGWFDIWIPEPRGKYHSLSIEMKRQDARLLKKDGTPVDERTKNQIEIWRYLNNINHCAVFAFGAKQALKFVDCYLRGMHVAFTNGLFSEMIDEPVDVLRDKRAV